MTPEASTLLELGRLLLPDRSAVRSGLQRLHDSQLKYAVTSRDLAAGRKVERTLWGSSTIMSLWRLSLPPSLRQNFWLPAHVSQSPTAHSLALALGSSRHPSRSRCASCQICGRGRGEGDPRRTRSFLLQLFYFDRGHA